VDYLCFTTITGSISLLVDYLCFYYHHWVDTSAGGLSLFYYHHWVDTSAGGLSMFLLPSLGCYLCWWTIYVFITITGLIPLLDYLCVYYYHWVDTPAGGLSMFFIATLTALAVKFSTTKKHCKILT
jgi:aryl-alcohol dehydrogenase-like predicted oxidoreductase